MGTRLDRAQSEIDLAARARSYAMEATAVDGMDILAVRAEAEKAVAAIRQGHGPVFLEFRTYRFRAHSMFDAELYREKAEVDLWKVRDPIATLAARVIRWGYATEASLLEVDAAIALEIADAVRFAEAGTWEPESDLLKDVCAPAPAPVEVAG